MDTITLILIIGAIVILIIILGYKQVKKKKGVA